MRKCRFETLNKDIVAFSSSFAVNVFIVLVKERYHLASGALAGRLECSVLVACHDILLGSPDNGLIEVICGLNVLELTGL